MDISIAQKLLEKNKADYEKIAEEFSKTRIEPWKEMEQFIEFVKLGDAILDLGCGNGRLLTVLKDKPIIYIGVDNSEKLIELARKKWGESDKRKFLVGDALDLSFLEFEKFDTVFCIAMLHHIPSKESRLKVLNGIKQILKKNGLLIMTNWDLYQPRYLPYILKYIILKLFGRIILDWKDVLIPWHNKERKIKAWRYYHAFTKKEIKELLEEAGFRVVDLYYVKEGRRTNWRNGANLVIIARRQ